MSFVPSTLAIFIYTQETQSWEIILYIIIHIHYNNSYVKVKIILFFSCYLCRNGIKRKVLTTMATIKIAAANVPTAMYALCNPTVVPFETTALKLDSPNGRECVVAESSDRISFELTTVSTINSSRIFDKI